MLIPPPSAKHQSPSEASKDDRRSEVAADDDELKGDIITRMNQWPVSKVAEDEGWAGRHRKGSKSFGSS